MKRKFPITIIDKLSQGLITAIHSHLKSTQQNRHRVISLYLSESDF